MKTKAEYIKKLTELANKEREKINTENFSIKIDKFINLLPYLPLKALKDYYDMITTNYIVFIYSGSISATHRWSDSKLGFDYWHKLDKTLNGL